jgi:GMP reductase
MRIENDLKLDYSDVLLRPKRSRLGSRKEVSIKREFLHIGWNGVPIMAANMDGVGTFEIANELEAVGMFTCLKKNYDTAELIEFFTIKERKHAAMSIGITDTDFKKFCDVYYQCSKNMKYVCIDVANGYSERFVDFVRKIRHINIAAESTPLYIIAGNVVTGEMTEQLLLNGADIVKVGLGPGSACTTRIQTGVGYPQLSAVIECADAAHGLGGLIIADGGCTCPGDIAKAFAAGADFVMLGGMLAGHDEGGGEIIQKAYHKTEYDVVNGVIQNSESDWEFKTFVEFYGMSSKKANDIHFGGLKDYRAAEGREVTVPYRGKVTKTIQELLGGLRSACTYVGAENLKNLPKCATMIRVTNQYNEIFS